MGYRELPPPGPRAPHVACLWIREPEPVPRVHRVVPDACADVVWVEGERLVVAGPATGPVLSDVPAGAAAVGVRFRVGAAGSALGVPARELLDRTVDLSAVWGSPARELEERLSGAHDVSAAAALLAAEVGRRLPPPGSLDRAVRAAAMRVARPGVAVEALPPAVSVGERQLRRRFADAVGYGPKTLQRVLRFQRFLTLSALRPGEDLAALAFEAGYADQAHLTRECGRLSGLPPAALLRAGAGPAGERSDSFKTSEAGPATIAA
jgi:AraC-like DNA-binding protein